MGYYKGSFLPDNTEVMYWKHYDDRFLKVNLHVCPADERVKELGKNYLRYVDTGLSGSTTPIYSFTPPALSTQNERVEVQAQMTGGRTFLINPASVNQLGMVKDVAFLDLSSLGWGNGKLELQLEVKGAGTLFERTKIQKARLLELLKSRPDLERSFFDSIVPSLGEPIYSTLSTYLKRNIGGQSERYANHAVRASESQLGKSKIKFTPTWASVAWPDETFENLSFISQASDTPHYQGVPCNELRWTPSNIRALYFETAASDQQLCEIVRAISTNMSELVETHDQLLLDAKRHLELISCSTIEIPSEGFYWIKIGDINEKFVRSAEGEYAAAMDYRSKRYGWFLIKDEVVVNLVGKFFTDMEGFFGKDIGFLSETDDLLRMHHELAVLCILRDHFRLCVQFKKAMHLMETGTISDSKMRKLELATLRELTTSINSSECIHISITNLHIHISLAYPEVGSLINDFAIPREEIAERYNTELNL